MPELPEVETIRAVLEPQLEGMGIKDVILRHPGVIAHPDAGLFRATAAGRRITGLGRRDSPRKSTPTSSSSSAMAGRSGSPTQGVSDACGLYGAGKKISTAA